MNIVLWQTTIFILTRPAVNHLPHTPLSSHSGVLLSFMPRRTHGWSIVFPRGAWSILAGFRAAEKERFTWIHFPSSFKRAHISHRFWMCVPSLLKETFNPQGVCVERCWYLPRTFLNLFMLLKKNLFLSIHLLLTYWLSTSTGGRKPEVDTLYRLSFFTATATNLLLSLCALSGEEGRLCISITTTRLTNFNEINLQPSDKRTRAEVLPV